MASAQLRVVRVAALLRGQYCSSPGARNHRLAGSWPLPENGETVRGDRPTAGAAPVSTEKGSAERTTKRPEPITQLKKDGTEAAEGGYRTRRLSRMNATLATALVLALSHSVSVGQVTPPEPTAALQQRDGKFEDWSRLLVARSPEIDVTILHKEEASITEEEWLAVEYLNKTGEYIRFPYVNVAVVELHESGRRLSVLAECDSSLLLGREGLAPGKTTRTWWLSTSATASLARRWNKSQTVLCQVQASIESNSVDDQAHLDTAPLFAFDWTCPDENETLELARERLVRLLKEPDPRSPHGDLVAGMLRQKELASLLTIEQLLGALEVRSGSFDGLSYVAAAIVSEFGQSPLLAEWVHEHFQLGDVRIRKLMEHGYWNGSLLEPLTERAASKARGEARYAIEFLHKNREHWMPDASRSTQLFESLIELYPALEEDSLWTSESEFFQWSLQVRDLSMTGAAEAIEMLRPILSDRRQLRSTTGMLGLSPNSVMTLRPCDVACKALLTLLDGDESKGLRAVLGEEGGEVHREFENYPLSDEAILEMWDSAISAIERRLDK